MERSRFASGMDDFAEVHSDYWTVGILSFRTIGPSASDYRTIGLSDYWAFGLSGRHRIYLVYIIIYVIRDLHNFP